MILFIAQSPYASTSANIRNLSIIEGLILNNEKVDLIFFSNGLKIISINNIEDIKILKSSNITKLNSNNKIILFFKILVLKFMSHFLVHQKYFFLNYIPLNNLGIKKKYNLIISSSDPKIIHKLAFRIKKYYNLNSKIFQIWGDPFTTDVSRKLNKILKKSITKEEKNILNLSDRVYYLSKLTLESQTQMFPDFAKKMKYFYPPYLHESIYNINKFKGLKLLYLGDYYSSIRNLKNLYTSCLKENVDLTIVGASDVNLDSTAKIKIFPRTHFNDLLKFEKSTNINIVVGNLKGSQIPGKLFQCFGSNKPTILICEPFQYDFFVKEFSYIKKLIICINENQNIINAINKVLALISINGVLESNFSSKEITKQLL
jgi:hypothetical protein